MNDIPRRRRRPVVSDTAATEEPITTVEARTQEIPRDEPTPQRGEQREETSRERAERVAVDILERDEQVGDFIDKFPMPAGGPPDGWHYDWKKKSVMGWEDRSYAIQMASNGWRPVPTERHPEFMPTSGGYAAIEREGLILMEIPMVVAQRRQARAHAIAREQIEIKKQQMNHAPPGTFGRDNQGSSLVNIRRGYEPLTIPPSKAAGR